MNNSKQIFLTIFITSLVVGYAVNYWHSNNFEIVRVANVVDVNDNTLDKDYDFKENQGVIDGIQEQNKQDLDSRKSKLAKNNEIEIISSQFKTYTNSKSGYEVNYPIVWEYQEALTDSYNSTLFGLPSS